MTREAGILLSVLFLWKAKRTRMRIYVETTIWNVLAAGKDDQRWKASDDFMTYLSGFGHKAYVSALVVTEIERTTDADRKNIILQAMQANTPELLAETPEVRALADKYLEAGVVPVRFLPDAMHIAYATFFEMHILASWNLRHIVKVRTRRLVNHVNVLNGFCQIEIATPEEIIEYG